MSTGGRLRADRLLVERGYFESRTRAQGAIRAGLVSADDRVVERASDTLDPDVRIEARAEHPYVSRGGLKLAAALDAFEIDPTGRICLDVGASTGGFTDVLLRHRAARVHAVDVGRDQLHATLRADRRVVSLEGTDIRSLSAEAFDVPPSLAAIDVSFIALRLVLPAVAVLLTEDADILALVKPQFEAGRGQVGRGGIVRDPAVHDAVCTEVTTLIAALGLTMIGLVPSPIEGGDGNREFLIGARRSRVE